MEKLNSIMLADNGFNGDTIMKLIAAMLEDLRIPTTRICNNCIRFRPMGASTYGGYIYRSGVIMIFNEHHAPFSKDKLSFRDVLKELCRKSRVSYMPLYQQIERMRALYLVSSKQTYEEVYGFFESDSDEADADKYMLKSEVISDEEITAYVDTRIPYKNVIFDKIRGESTLWDIFRLVRGNTKLAKSLKNKTDHARAMGKDGKLTLPVVYPNFHLVEVENKFLKMPNHLIMLDFDLKKQGVDKLRGKRARAIMENMPETIAVSESFTQGNFWAIVAASEPKSSYQSLACSILDEIERRLGILAIQLDRTSANMTQARILVSDKNAVVKHPTMKFVEVLK